MNNGTIVKVSPDLFPKFLAKIKGDAGLYKVFGVNTLAHELYVYRACGYEWIPFRRIQDLTYVTTYDGIE